MSVTDDLDVRGFHLLTIALENSWSGEGIHFNLIALDDETFASQLLVTGGDSRLETHVLSHRKRRAEALEICLTYLAACAGEYMSGDQYQLALALVSSGLLGTSTRAHINLTNLLEIDGLVTGESTLDTIKVESHLPAVDLAAVQQLVDTDWSELVQPGSAFREAVEATL